MRKQGIRFLEILHSFLLISGIYQALALLIEVYDTTFFIHSFFLLPVVAVFSLSVWRVKHFWQFFGLVILGEAGVWLVTKEGFERIWMVICVAVVAVLYFMARAAKKTCWLEQPFYPWLLFYLVFYLMGYRIDNELAMYLASVSAGVYFLVCNFHTNLCEVDTFVRTHSNLERFPSKRIGRINQWMMWSISGLTAIAMMFAPFLKIEEVIRRIGRGIRNAVSWLLHLLPEGGIEAGTAGKEAAQQLPPMEPVKDPSLFLEILYKLMDILGWVFALGLVLWGVRWALRRIFYWYRQFHTVVEENGDRIERLEAIPGGERKKNLEKAEKEHLFWDRSPNARIRKHYKKRVLRDWKRTPKAEMTPKAILEETTLSQEEQTCFLQYYEKARYGKEQCSKEEVNEMLKIR